MAYDTAGPSRALAGMGRPRYVTPLPDAPPFRAAPPGAPPRRTARRIVPPSQVAPLPRRAHAALLSATLALLGACAPGPRPTTAPTPEQQPDVPAVTTPSDLPEPPTNRATPFVMPPRPHVHLPGVEFDLDVHAFEDEDRVQHYVRLFTGNARTTFTTWLSRGSRYDGMIRAKLRAAGLPEDLYYLPLVESGYDPNAVSRASAVGMWQFMAPTARGLGLRVDWWMDERRDPVRSTDGAVRHLKWLKGQYGSFFLAAAAYNGGSTRVTRGLAQLAAASDSSLGDARFFALVDADYLRPETKNYVPQLIAATLVAKELPRYQLTVRGQPAFAYDSVTVAPLTPLAAVARAANASRAELLELNPQFLRGMTPPDGRAMVRVPVGASAGFATRLAKLDADARRAFRRVTTRKRDSFADIASREEVPLALLTAYNPALETVEKGKWKGRLVSGQGVRVPTAAVLEYARPTIETNDAAGVGELPALPAPKVAERPAAREKAKPQIADAAETQSEKSVERSTEKSRARSSERAAERVAAAEDGDSARPAKRAADRTPAGDDARVAKADAEEKVEAEAPSKSRRARTADVVPLPLATVARAKPVAAKATRGGASKKAAAEKVGAAGEVDEPKSDEPRAEKSGAKRKASGAPEDDAPGTKPARARKAGATGKAIEAGGEPAPERTKAAAAKGAKAKGAKTKSSDAAPGAERDSKDDAKEPARGKAKGNAEPDAKGDAEASSKTKKSGRASAKAKPAVEAEEKPAARTAKAARSAGGRAAERERAAVDSAARRPAKRGKS